MSLLFDALQRASKEKERAAGAATPPGPTTPQATQPNAEAPLEFSLAPAEPVAPEGEAQAPATPTPKPLTMAPIEPPKAAAQGVPPPAAPEPTVKPPPPSPSPAVERVHAQRSPQVARELMKASALPERRGPNKLLMAFAGIAVLLALSLGALFLFEFLNKPSGLATPQLAQTPAPATNSVPAALPAAAPPAVPAPVAVAPQAVPAPAEAPRTAPPAAAPQEEPAPTSMRARPVFTAKPGGSRTLDAAYAALLDGRLDAAAAAYRQALASNPDERDALLGLAHIAHRQGRNDEARAFYQGVLRLEPNHPVAQAGLLALADADTEYPVSRAREIAEQNPESAAAQSALGSALAREGLLADAQQAFFQAMSLEPNHPLHAYNLAVALDRLHKPDLARTYYERALKLAEQSSPALRRNFPRETALKRLEELRSDGVVKP